MPTGEKSKLLWRTPDYRNRVTEAIKKSLSGKDVSIKRSLIAKDLWEKPAYQKKRGKSLKKFHKTHPGFGGCPQPKGEKSPWWKGGVCKNGGGYVLIYSPNHPFKNPNNYYLFHRLVMESKLGRYLTEIEVVHHINGINDDNRIENLWLFPNNGAHTSYENNVRKTHQKWVK